jgi:histidine ammonia-lyase
MMPPPVPSDTSPATPSAAPYTMPVPAVSIAALDEDLLRAVAAIKGNLEPVRMAREWVERASANSEPLYGINTGFGALATSRISDDRLRQLQQNLLISHAVGVGPAVPKEISRLMLQLKIVSLGQGYSGVSESTLGRLIALLDHDLIPVIPEKGSVGASGDLAPLAHMSLPLIGAGEVWDDRGVARIPAETALGAKGWEPVDLQSKDGLALINGTQFMAAYGAWVLHCAIDLLKTADIIAAMSLEALQGSIRPFDARIHQVRPHPGQIAVAGNIRALLANSEILESHRHCGKVQDPYCLRCVPQVHGASRDALAYAAAAVERELNSVTDNPLVFDDGDIVSGGNFHGQPLAIAMDTAKIALAELASISERRTYLLLEGHDGLPKLLMSETGINSGFMIPQYTAAALVSENKVLCHPSSVDSIPTSLGQEDHVSMGSISAIHLLRVFHNVRQVLAIELFTASQALDFRAPMRPGEGVEAAHRVVRGGIPFAAEDRAFATDIAHAEELITSGALSRAVGTSGITLA